MRRVQARGPIFSPRSVFLLLVAASAWFVTIYLSRDMSEMSGTMGLGALPFLGIWILMMSAMMLPAVAPVALTYDRLIRSDRVVRVPLFAGGYLSVWAAAGLPALILSRLIPEHMSQAMTTTVAAMAFVACGIYQWSPAKARCLKHCRSPMSLLLRYSSYRGRFRDAAAGAHHGAYCLGCCWALFALLFVFGVMNIAAMLVLAMIALLEKVWSRGESLSRAVGVACLGLAVAVVFMPSLAAGLSIADPGMGGM
jgi:predicted metal-binding membrane protein